MGTITHTLARGFALVLALGILLGMSHSASAAAPTVTASTAGRAVNAPTAVTLTINGTNFSTTPANNTVAFSTLGAVGNVTAATATQLTVTFTTVPTGLGSLTAIVTVAGNGNSGAAVQVANIVAAPTVTSSTLNRALNAPTTVTLTINGTGFDAVTPANNTVAFSTLGAAGNVTAATATALTVTFSTLPNAVGSLTAIVTTDGGTSGAATQVATVVAAPTVTSSTAGRALNAPTTFTLTINGTGFSTTPANNTVAFSTLSAVGTVTAATATQLTVTFSTLPSGLGSLTAIVTSNGGNSGAAVQVATVVPAPTVTSSTLNRALNAPTTFTLAIAGTGFDAVTPANNSVAFSTLGAVGSVTAATATQLTVTFSTVPTGLGSLTAIVTTDGGTSGAAVQVATVVAAPTVTSSTAGRALNAPTTFTLTINGTGFSTTPANNTVAFSTLGAVGSVTAATATQLTVTFSTVPTGLGSLTAIVTSNGGTSGAATQVATVVAAPTVTSNTLNRALNAPTTFTLTINGTGFDTTPANNSVAFSTLGAVGSVTAATATQLTVTFSTVPTGLGSLTAIVTTDGGTSGAAVQVATVVAAPTVTSSTAGRALNAPTTFTLTINGTGFSTTPANNTVAFSTLGAVGSVTAATATQLTVTFSTVPTGLGSLTAIVTSNGGTSGAATQVATVVAAPTVTSSTASRALNAPTTFTLTINGTGFDAVTPANNSVAFSTLGAVGSVTAATATALTVTFSTVPTGTGSLTAIVTTDGGTSGAATQVATVVASPTVTASTLNRALNAPTTFTLTINGTNFSTTPANNSVAFSLGAIGTVTAATTTQLTVTFSTVPTGTGSLTANVTVFGGSTGAVQVATVVGAPTVTAGAINRALNAPTTVTLVITGTNFDTNIANNSVAFNLGAVGNVTAATTTSLTVTFTTVPNALGGLTAVVTSGGGTSGSAVQVANIVPAPIVTSTTTNQAINSTTLTITGSNFDTTAGNNTLVFSLGAIGTVTTATATSLTVTLSTVPTSVGNLTVIVTTDGGNSGAATQVATVIPVVTLNTANIAANAATVVIAGFGFSTTPANNVVTFGTLGAVGNVTAASATSLTVTFTTTPVNAGFLTASVAVTNGTAFSSGTPVQVATVIPVVTQSTANLSTSAATLTINGFGFASSNGSNSVVLNLGAGGSVTSSSPTQIVVTFITKPTVGNLTAVVTSNALSSGTAVQVATVIATPVISTLTLANWTVNKAGYSQTILASGGSGGIVFAVGSGSLPTGLALSAAGALTGTPTVAGNFNFTVTATDTLNAAGSQAYTVVINPAVVFTTTTAPAWTINKAGYSRSLVITGGTGASTFGLTAGALPAGLGLSSAGVLSGTPTAAGSFNFTVTATDTVGATGSQAYTVIINTAVTLPVTLPNWTVQFTYSQALIVTGGTGTDTFALTTGALPDGLTLSAAGLVSGTPTVASTFNFTITATDSVGATGSQAYTVTINPAVTITETSLPDWTINIAGYTQTVHSANGTGSLTLSVSSGAIPTGMTFTGATGVLAGTPTASGKFNFTLTATDSVGATGSQAYTVTINTVPTFTAATLANWTINKSGYAQTVVVTGGTGASTFAVTAGALPDGLGLSTNGSISGTPTVASTFNFTITATDPLGAIGTKAYTVTINTPLILTGTLASWTISMSSYSQSVAATGGTPAVTYAVTTGTLPTGVSLSTAGVLSGTLTATGTFVFTIVATDASGATATHQYTVKINSAIAFTTTTLPDLTAGTPFNQTILVSGGTGTRTQAVTTGAIPTGLTLTTAGVLSGTPTTVGNYSFTITATDAIGATGTQAFAMSVNPGVTVSPASLPNWTVNKSGYSKTITSANGAGTKTLSVSAGSIPTGLTFTPGTGVIAGTPTAAGTFNFTITATDTASATGFQAYTVVINPAVTLTTTTLPNGVALAAAYSQTVAYSGGTGTSTLAVTAGTLPPGISLSTAGLLSGTATTQGTYNFTVTATDTLGATGSKALALTITASTPAVISPTSAAITSNSATLGGSVSNDGGAAITAFGVVVTPTANVANLLTGGSGVITLTSAGSMTNFVVQATALTPGTPYSFAAYATNSQGNGYTSVGTFTTLSNDATLSNLVVAPVTFTPVFSTGVTTYRATVPNSTSSVTVTPTTNQANATTKINGTLTSTGRTLPLNVGVNAISVGVTAQDGTTTSTYTVNIVRDPAFIAVYQPAGTALINGGSTTDFGGTGVGKTATRTFTVKNIGVLDLNSFALTFDGAAPGDFAVTTPPPATLAAGASGTFTLTFTPAAVGARVATLHINASGETGNPFDLGLTGTGVAQPAITMQPASQIVALGQPIALSVTASGGALSYQWLKNDVVIPGATSNSYNVAAAALTHAGAYTCKATNSAGFAPSLVANVGVVTVAPTSTTLIAGTTLTLTTTAAGPGLTYKWSKNAMPMSDGPNPANALGTVSGTSLAKLVITKVDSGNADAYTCAVTMPDPQNAGMPLSLASGVFTVHVTIKPVLDAFAPGPWIVSGNVTDLITAQNFPTAFTVTGLPTGVTVDPKSGQLKGKPTVAISIPTTYLLTITASNAAGAGASLVKVPVVVNPLQANAVGTFNALVDRDAVLSSGYGGTLSVSSLNTGVFSGKLTLGALSYPFTAQHLDAKIGANPSVTVPLARKLPLKNLAVTFSINTTTGELTGSVTDGVIASPVPIDGWRTTTGTPLAAVYTSALDLDATLDGNAAYPQGTGYGTLTVTTAGIATWSGKMADGSVSTCSSGIGSTGKVALHSMLNLTNTASMHGWVTASAGTPRLLDGSVDWFKHQALTVADRTYHDGIPLNTLTVIGGEYVAPATGTRVLNLGATAGNAKLTFASANLESSVTYKNVPNGPTKSLDGLVFTVPATNVPVMPPAASNPATLTLPTFSAKTGAFGGTFVLKGDPDTTAPKPTLVTRTVSYFGLLVPRASVHKGVGFFLLAQLPSAGPPVTTASTSPFLSGQVLLESTVP